MSHLLCLKEDPKVKIVNYDIVQMERKFLELSRRVHFNGVHDRTFLQGKPDVNHNI